MLLLLYNLIAKSLLNFLDNANKPLFFKISEFYSKLIEY